MRQQKRTTDQAAGFLAVLAREVTGTVLVADADHAVEVLWSSKALGYRPREPRPGETWRDLLSARLFAQARAELLEATEGQPFRLDAPDGPLFVLDALWRFADYSGEELTAPAGVPNRDRPSWRRRQTRAA